MMSIYSKSITFNLDKVTLKVHPLSVLTIFASSFQAVYPGNEGVLDAGWQELAGEQKSLIQAGTATCRRTVLQTDWYSTQNFLPSHSLSLSQSLTLSWLENMMAWFQF